MNKFLSKYNVKSVDIILLLALTILIPSGFYNFEGIFIAFLFVYGFIIKKGYKNLKFLSKESLLLSLFFLNYIIGFFFTKNLNQQFNYTTQHISFLLIPLSFLGLNISKNTFLKIKKWFVFSTLFFVILAVILALYSMILTGKSTVYVNDSVQSKFSYYGLTRAFNNWHPTYVSFFLNLCIIFSYSIYFKQKKYISGGLVLVLSALGIFMLNSITGILCLGIILSTGLFITINSWWKSSLVLIIGVSMATLFYYFNPFGFSKIDQFKKTGISVTDKKTERNILSLRIVKWEASYNLFKESPLFGVSTGDFKDKMVEYYKANEFDYAAKQRFSSHNQYLYVLGAFGLFGFLIFLAIIIFPIGSGFEMALFLISFSIFCLTEDIFERQQGLICFVFMYILLSHRKIE